MVRQNTEDDTSDENASDLAGIHCRLDELLADRGITLTRLSEIVGVSIVNLSVLKNDRAKAIRFSTLQAICAALECEVGELLVHRRAQWSAKPPRPTIRE